MGVRSLGEVTEKLSDGAEETSKASESTTSGNLKCQSSGKIATYRSTCFESWIA